MLISCVILAGNQSKDFMAFGGGAIEFEARQSVVLIGIHSECTVLFFVHISVLGSK